MLVSQYIILHSAALILTYAILFSLFYHPAQLPSLLLVTPPNFVYFPDADF